MSVDNGAVEKRKRNGISFLSDFALIVCWRFFFFDVEKVVDPHPFSLLKSSMFCSRNFLLRFVRTAVSLKLQKRLAASVLKCGERKIWLDLNEIREIALANSRRNIARLQRDGLIIKKPTVVHSRAQAPASVSATKPRGRDGTRVSCC